MPPRRKSPQELSHRPEQMRNRIRRKAGRADEEIDHYIKVHYQKPIDEWDWEELAKGRVRDKRGGFRGRAAPWITPLVVREARRRLIEGVYGELGTSAKYALQTLHRLVTDGEVDDKVALDAAKYIIDHIIGKPKALVEIDASDNVRQFLARALVLDDGKPQHQVIDGQYTTDDRDEDDDDD
jgi:hypothetical protein